MKEVMKWQGDTEVQVNDSLPVRAIPLSVSCLTRSSHCSFDTNNSYQPSAFFYAHCDTHP
jgi:hypothetical protein